MFVLFDKELGGKLQNATLQRMAFSMVRSDLYPTVSKCSSLFFYIMKETLSFDNPSLKIYIGKDFNDYMGISFLLHVYSESFQTLVNDHLD